MDNDPGYLLPLLTYLAVIASAISGALEARKQDMDVVGATTTAFVTAFGGGTIRDLLLGRTPIFWLVDAGLSIVTLFGAILAYYRLNRISNRLLFLPDAIGLGLFSILGVTYALQMQLNPIVAVTMGVVTGVFGGVMRDVICNQIPNVFQKNTELYATCSFIGAWIFVLLSWLKVDPSISAWAATGIIVVFRIFAVRFQLRLPQP